MKLKNVFLLVGCILLPLVVGGLSGYATVSSISTWYVTLQKPSFNPPNYLFGPVWTALYTLMGISLFLVARTSNSALRTSAFWVFGIQLALNFMWSVLFFNFHWLGFALLEILLMWLSILVMIRIFRQLSPAAGYLQIPYLLWVSFATLLNASIWYLNR